MRFELAEAMTILERTPAVLRRLLAGLDERWIRSNEGEETWSPFDVVGHLIHGEKTDWIGRARIILARGDSIEFEPFDRFAQFEASRGRSLDELLDEFEELRRANLVTLGELGIGDDELSLPGLHPGLGDVTLSELLATWVAHDLGHIAQIARVMAKQYSGEVGPWRAYLGVLSDRTGG